MTAYYFKIMEYDQATCQTGGLMFEGIARDEDDYIRPPDDADIPVSLRRRQRIKDFSHPDYRLQGYYFTMTEELCERRRLD